MVKSRSLPVEWKMVNGLVNNIIVSFQNVIHRGFIFTKGTRCLGRKFIEIYRKTNRYAFYRHIPKDRCQNGKVWQMNQSRKNTKNAHGKASCLEKRSYRTHPWSGRPRAFISGVMWLHDVRTRQASYGYRLALLGTELGFRCKSAWFIV